jgi:ribulose-5-phosphate 4-epimerase/fuculose-1-phosphate aldolase
MQESVFMGAINNGRRRNHKKISDQSDPKTRLRPVPALLGSRPMNHEMLATITALSHEFGAPDFVKGGGGNTSCKDAATLWVKPSGTTLAGLTPEKFIALDRAKLAKLYETPMPAGAPAREAVVKELMLAAVCGGTHGRPSVEAPLHDILPGTYVVHTHSTLVNGMTCARGGAAACARLFPDALWIPYIDPGFTLCMEVRRRIRGHRLIILENHGIFVSGDSAAEVRDTYRRVLTALRAEYARAGIPTELNAGAIPPVTEPITPDHMVYAQHPKLGPEMAADCALVRQLAAAFGGLQLLSAPAQEFIRNWEVEAYRQKQVA